MDERERRASGRSSGRNNGNKRPAGRNDRRLEDRRSQMRRRNKNSRRRRRRRLVMIKLLLLIIIVIAAAGGFFIWNRYGSSSEKADLGKYYGLDRDGEFAVIINNEVVRADEGEQDGAQGAALGKLYDGQYYLEYSVVRDRINKRFYWDSNENVLLYTLPGGSVSAEVGSREYTDISEKKSEEYVILKTEGETAYIALPFIQQYTDMEYQVYDDQGVTRVVVVSDWGETTTAKVKRDTEVRYQGGVKSPVLTEVGKSEQVTVLEDEDDWMKVGTEDGFIGYVKTNHLKDFSQKVADRAFVAPEYTNLSKNYTVNMAWHNVFVADANGYLSDMVSETKGLTTVAPTWFSIADTEGNLSSLADSDYVNTAHQLNLEVWAVLRDFHGGIHSYEETYEVLSYTSKRTRLINQVVAEAIRCGVDGINLDFELVSSACGEHFIQFVRELSVKCRQNGLVFSVDNYVPQPYNAHYDIEEQGEVADYVIIMCYDEHTDGSYEAGSVASLGYLRDGISDALKYVPENKLIAGIPFYTRLWRLTPKTAEELASEEGTEAAQYVNKVSSQALDMEDAAATVAAAGVQAAWDDRTQQNFAQWEQDGSVYQIWLEDAMSLEEKLKLIQTSQLAGVAEWSLGMESSNIWDLILRYVN